MPYSVDYSTDYQHADGVEEMEYSGNGTTVNVNARRGSASRADFPGEFGVAPTDVSFAIWNQTEVVIAKEQTLTDEDNRIYTIVQILAERPDGSQTVVLGRLQP